MQRTLGSFLLLTSRLGPVIRRLPAYARLAWRLLWDPNVPLTAKALLGASVAYSVAPVDLVPGFLPVLGQLDDLVVFLLGVGAALRSLPPWRATAHLAAVRLTPLCLRRDVDTVRAVLREVAFQAAAGTAIAGLAVARWLLSPRRRRRTRARARSRARAVRSAPASRRLAVGGVGPRRADASVTLRR